MGTHSYIISATIDRDNRKAIPENLIFDTLYLESFSNACNFRLIDFEEYIKKTGCRGVLENAVKLIWGKDYDILMGIRAFGEQYTKVSRIFAKNSNGSDIVSNFWLNTLQVNSRIVFGTAPVDAPDNKFPVQKIITYRNRKGKTVHHNDRGYMTMFFYKKDNRNVSNFSMRISTILALMREPIICRGILRGKIIDMESLIKAILELATIRGTKKDCSYFSTRGVVSDSENFTFDELWSKLRERQNDAINSDASDFYSLTLTATYLHNINKKCGWNSALVNGPVSLARSKVDSPFLVTMKNELGIQKLTRILAERIKNRFIMQYDIGESWIFMEAWK